MNRQERRALNRANAAHSTGPVTAEGKQVASQNALKHGLTAMRTYLPHEEQEYLRFADTYLADWNPQSPLELDLLRTMIDLQWRLKRIPALEARLFADPDAEPMKLIRALDVLSRHQVRLNKLYIQTRNELQAIVSIRRNQHIPNPLTQSAGQIGFVLHEHTDAPPPDARNLPASTSSAPSDRDSGFVSHAA